MRPQVIDASRRGSSLDAAPRFGDAIFERHPAPDALEWRIVLARGNLPKSFGRFHGVAHAGRAAQLRVEQTKARSHDGTWQPFKPAALRPAIALESVPRQQVEVRHEMLGKDKGAGTRQAELLEQFDATREFQ